MPFTFHLLHGHTILDPIYYYYYYIKIIIIIIIIIKLKFKSQGFTEVARTDRCCLVCLFIVQYTSKKLTLNNAKVQYFRKYSKGAEAGVKPNCFSREALERAPKLLNIEQLYIPY